MHFDLCGYTLTLKMPIVCSQAARVKYMLNAIQINTERFENNYGLQKYIYLLSISICVLLWYIWNKCYKFGKMRPFCENALYISALEFFYEIWKAVSYNFALDKLSIAGNLKLESIIHKDSCGGSYVLTW